MALECVCGRSSVAVPDTRRAVAAAADHEGGVGGGELRGENGLTMAGDGRCAACDWFDAEDCERGVVEVKEVFGGE